MWIVRQGATDDLWNAADLHLEDGSVVEGVKALPPDLPLGYHHLIPLDGWPSSQLVVAPAHAHPVGERGGGGPRSSTRGAMPASWGIGDLGDLARLPGSSRPRSAGPGAQPAARRRPRAPAAAEPLLPRESDVEEPPPRSRSTLSPERPHRATRSPASPTRRSRAQRTKAHGSRCSVPAQASRRSTAFSRGGRRTHRKRSVASSLRSVRCTATTFVSSPSTARSPSATAAVGAHGHRAITPRGREASPASPGSTSVRTSAHVAAVAARRAAGSGCRERLPAGGISRSASTPAAWTHGCGKTARLSTLTWAPLLTASTSRDRTGDFRRSSRGAAGATSIRSSRLCGQRCAA